MTVTTQPTTVKGYKYASIEGATGGFGMYQVHPNLGEDFYADTTDLIYACEPQDYVSTDTANWEQDEDTELVAAINEVQGRTYNEPEILVAMRDRNDNVTVFGIVIFDCYELANGQYIEVAAYNNDPESYELAQ